MISSVGSMLFGLVPYLATIVLVVKSWSLFTSRRPPKPSASQPDIATAERWLCRTLFRTMTDANADLLAVSSGQLVSVVNPIGRDWIFGQHCESGAKGWIPQSALHPIQSGLSARLDRLRLEVRFRDDHWPTTAPPPVLTSGIIWCIVVFAPDRPSPATELGHLSGHIAIVELSPAGRSVRVGGPSPIAILDPAPMHVDADTFLDLFSFVHTRLHPQRLLVVIDADGSPCSALSGSWNGESTPRWISMQRVAPVLRRVHLRCPIAALALRSPSKATLSTVHILHSCCTVLIGIQACFGVVETDLIPPDLIKALTIRPNMNIETLISLLIVPWQATAINCALYPATAILIKSFLSVVHSSLAFMDTTDVAALARRLRPLVLRSTSGALIDEFVDVLGFCSAAVEAIPPMEYLSMLDRRLRQSVMSMIVQFSKRAHPMTMCGLSMHFPNGEMSISSWSVLSQRDTYLKEMLQYYQFYDTMPILQKRIFAPRSSIDSDRAD